VALVRVLSVTCLSVNQDPKSGEMLPSYSAKLELMEVVKGGEAKGDVVNVYFDAVPSLALGAWSVFYYPGEMVWTRQERQLQHDRVERARRDRAQGRNRRTADHAWRERRTPACH
jgi:hypothetical protein